MSGVESGGRSLCSSVIQTKSCSDKALIFWVTLLCPTFGFGMGVCTQHPPPFQIRFSESITT